MRSASHLRHTLSEMLRASLFLCAAARAASALSVSSRPVIGRPPVAAAASLRCAVRPLMCDAPPAEEAPPPPREEAFAKLDVRVGKIVEAWPHPESDKLWCEKIDVGEEEPREIASGIRAYYAEASDLEGKSVLVVCNLKPAKLGGFPSNGMVFCGTSEDKSKVEFVEPPAEAQPGERVVCEGWVMPEPASANQVRPGIPSAVQCPVSYIAQPM